MLLEFDAEIWQLLIICEHFKIGVGDVVESVNGINARELPTRSSKPYNVYITVYLFLFLIVESVSHFNQFYDDGHVMQSNDYFLIKDYAILSFISSQCSVKFVLKFIARIIGISFDPKVQGGIDIKYIKY